MQTTLKRVVFIRSDRYLVSSRSRHNRETKQRNREIMWCPIIQGFHISCLREGLHCMVTTTCRCYQYHTSGQCGRGPSELASVSRPVGNSCLQTSQLLVSAWYGPYRMVHMFKYNALARPSSLLHMRTAVPDNTRIQQCSCCPSSVCRAERRTGSTFFASYQEYHTSVIGTIGEGS